ncbi:hypothetical protein CC78DRAFT_527845 [Lojkania enalia]|uniref:Uncharacterized protein n=1 Tax=Lojkania enalia TaxID=147567 RepID=A0A9P4NCS1_9PLEO|nr:hypothetical protein CC78DRAFT_527845 [Didymosphaeria enalia]
MYRNTTSANTNPGNSIQNTGSPTWTLYDTSRLVLHKMNAIHPHYVNEVMQLALSTKAFLSSSSFPMP